MNKRWLIGGIITLLLILLVWWSRTQFQIDRCLDAGGRWNSQTDSCDR